MKGKIVINTRWVVRTTLLTFALAILFSVVSEALIRRVNVFAALFLLLVIVFLGIFFDAIGVAVAAGDEKPFHAMAAAKVPRAKYSLKLIKNAAKVSNFCNDVVGDIVGIVSGTTIGIIVGFFTEYNLPINLLPVVTVIISGVVAALTVGGKAIGKDIAITRSKEVLDLVGMFLYGLACLFALETYQKRRPH